MAEDPAGEYTPTTARVRECYSALRRGSGTYAPDEFDRWLPEHDARVIRDALNQVRADQLKNYGVVLPDVVDVINQLKAIAHAAEKGQESRRRAE